VNWTKNVSFNQDANPVKVVNGVDVYETSVDTFPRIRFCSDSSESSVGGVECGTVDHMFDICPTYVVWVSSSRSVIRLSIYHLSEMSYHRCHC
jgi:hypothetical protein